MTAHAGTMRNRSAVAAVIAMACALLVAALPSRAEDRLSQAWTLVESSRATLEQFLSRREWEALRNLLGGARAIYIAPSVKKGGFLLGIAGGDGVLMRRHGLTWSDPVFMSIRTQSLGMQAGVETSNMIMVIMTDAGVDELLAGVAKVGGSGGFALASWGASANAAGGVSGGIQVLTMSTNKGAFAGGGMERTEMSAATEYNDVSYGVGSQLVTIATGSGRGKIVAEKLQTLLGDATMAAWDVK
jgi:SH3 domain-containing YSC84-like protein 1